MKDIALKNFTINKEMKKAKIKKAKKILLKKNKKIWKKPV